MEYILEFLLIVFVRIPLMCISVIFITLFISFIFIVLTTVIIIDVFLHIIGLPKNQTSCNIESKYDIQKE